MDQPRCAVDGGRPESRFRVRLVDTRLSEIIDLERGGRNAK